MADISLIKINKTNMTYGVKDAEARQGIANIKDGVTIDSFSDVESALADKVDAGSLGTAATMEAGAANGVATLDNGGKVPASQLPSYVDDVLEYADEASFPVTGEEGKIYVDVATGKTYRWSGSLYIGLNTYDEATQSASGLMSRNDKIKLDGVDAGAEVNVQSDWNVTDNASDAYIKNKPSITQIKQYSEVLDKDAWITEQGSFSYTLSIPTLKCGNDGSVAPIITPISNIEEYSTIASATATVGTGIVFVAPVKPTKGIGIIVQDVG